MAFLDTLKRLATPFGGAPTKPPVPKTTAPSPTYTFGFPSTPAPTNGLDTRMGGATTSATIAPTAAPRPAIPSSTGTSSLQSNDTALRPGQFGAGPFATIAADGTSTPSPYATGAFSAPVVPQVASTAPKSPYVAPTSPAAPIAPNTSQATAQSSAPPAASSTGSAAPATPSIGASAMSTAESAYKRSLELSPDELSTQEDLDKLIESAKKGYLGTSQQAIPMEFITGQLKAIEDRAATLAEPLERKLSRLQAARQSSLDASKFALERADKAAEANKPIEVGAGTSVVKYNPATGQYESVFSTPEKKTLPTSAQEYEYDVANGYKGSYEQYQNDDANRKRSVTNVSVGGGGSSGTGGKTGNPTIDSWVDLIQSKQATISSVPAAYKNAVAQALSSAPAVSSGNNLAQDALDAITALETTAGMKGAIGTNLMLGFGKNIPGSASAGYLAQLDRVKALLTLPNLQYMKGLGAMSDREFNTISSSVAALNPNMSEAQYSTELARIKTVMQAAVDKINAGASGGAANAPQQMQLLNGTIVTRQADGTYQ